MTIYKKITEEDPGRLAMREIRIANSRRAAASPELEGLLPDVDGDEKNKLPAALRNVENNVHVSEILEGAFAPNRQIEFWLTWAGRDIEPSQKFTTTTSPVSVDAKLPATATVAGGVFPLGYRYTYQGNEYVYHTPVDIFIDTEAPNRGAPGTRAILPPEVVDGLLTKEYLAANNGVLLTIPTPGDTRTGDIVEVFYGASDPAKKIGSFEVSTDHTVPVTVQLTLANVILEGEGRKIFYYQWRDRVGNIGPHSVELVVNVVLKDAPSNLKPPQVPEAAPPERLIDLKDAFPSVGVVISMYDNWEATDEIEVSWDGRKQPRKPVGSGFDVIVDVLYADIRAGGLGPRTDVPVTYSVWRGGLEYPEGTGTLVNVDLTRPGPLPPDPENPEDGNSNLDEVKVQGAVTTEPNKLELVDAEANATATFIIADPHEDGDTYTLYWDGVEVPGATYTSDGTEADDFEIEFQITPDFFKGQGNNPGVKVHYEITNPASPNPNSSLRQKVSVYVNQVILPVPKVRHTESSGGFDYITCKSLRDFPNVGWGVAVDVPGGEPLGPNMELKCVWSGVSWQTGAPVPVPDFAFSKTLSGNEHIDGFSVYLPLATALNPIRDGNGAFKYTANIGGRDESSAEHKVEVVVRDGENGDCPL